MNQISVPGFENSSGATPTQVTVTYSDVAVAAGCVLYTPDAGLGAVVGTNPATDSLDTSATRFTGIGDSFLGGLDCDDAGLSGTYTADIKIQFTAGGKSYTANTTLTAVVP